MTAPVLMYSLSALHIYPVKSLGGISVSEAEITATGLLHDRRWMLTDPSGHFLTQRQHPVMALLRVDIRHDHLMIWHLHEPQAPLHISLTPPDTQPWEVIVWDDRCMALPVGKEADAWFERFLGMPARLVYMPDSTQRLVDPRYAKSQEITSFSDGYPFLIIGKESLHALNHRLTDKGEAALPMNRFRPNLVFEGGMAHEEDRWAKFRVGEALFLGVKPCARCVVTTIEQETALKGSEPLRTLATYRRKDNKIYFGQNLLCAEGQRVRVGDRIEVLEWSDWQIEA